IEEAPKPPPPPLPPRAPLPAPARRRFAPPPVLVATAEPALSRMLSFALEQMRLPYRLLESGPVALRELLEMAVTSHPPIVLLDVDLPGVDGHAILERIGVKRPDAFLILVLSSHADESVQVRSLLAGAVDHLAKPFNVRVLMAKIQRWTTMAAHLAGAA
ncbi:MAG: response regulator transcription factor, partial [Gemmatimonadaceae bacterium]